MDFIKGLCYTWPNLGISRVDPGAKEKEIRSYLERVQQAFQEPSRRLTVQEAETLRRNLLASQGNEQLSQGVRQEAAQMAERLDKGLELQKTYVEKEQEILLTIGQVNAKKALEDMILAIKQIEKLPALTCVGEDEALTADVLRKKGLKKLHELIEYRKTNWINLDKIEDYTAKHSLAKKFIRELTEINDTEGLATLEGIQKTLEEKRAALEAEQNDRDVILQLDAMLLKGIIPLQDLRSRDAHLRTMKVQSEKAKNLLNTKRKEVTDSIAALQSFANGLQSRLDALKNVEETQRLQAEIYRMADVFDGTDLAGVVQESTSRCQQLCTAFDVLEVKGIPGTPAQLTERRTDLENAIKTANNALSPQQKALFDRAILEVDAEVVRQQKSAREWLEKCEMDFQNAQSDYTTLLRELGRPPAFLPEPEQPRLKNLVECVTLRRDENEVEAIVYRFKSIKDPELRNTCLRELIQLAQEAGEWK